jgi:hypothetical protein
VVDYAILKGVNNEIIIKELLIASYGIIQTCQFKSPYEMAPNTRESNKSSDNGISWDDGNASYSQLSTVLNEAVAGYDHLYTYGTAKCNVLSDLIHHPFLNLEHFKCPRPRDLKSVISCGFPCPSFRPCTAQLALSTASVNG